MSGESLRGDVYTEGRLKPVTLIFSGLVAWAYVCVCVCKCVFVQRVLCRSMSTFKEEGGDAKCLCGNRANEEHSVTVLIPGCTHERKNS